MADFQFRARPATVGGVVARSDSDSSGCRFEVHGVGAFTVYPLKAP